MMLFSKGITKNGKINKLDYIICLLIVIVILAFLSYTLAEQHHYEIYYLITVGFLATSFSLAFSSAYYRILR